ncbi:MAG: hypothetical protein ABEI52_05010 [Halobacteriaceae archaeon]
MTDVHRCDRTSAHEDMADALFVEQHVTIQTARGATLELCPSCAAEFETWWGVEESTESDETIGDNLE